LPLISVLENDVKLLGYIGGGGVGSFGGGGGGSSGGGGAQVPLEQHIALPPGPLPPGPSPPGPPGHRLLFSSSSTGSIEIDDIPNTCSFEILEPPLPPMIKGSSVGTTVELGYDIRACF